MPPNLTYPGVYVQEVAGSVRPIAGVSTGTALFVGATERGPHNDATLTLSYEEFATTFGDDSAVGQMARQVELFFANGGRTAYVMRVANGATKASVALQNEAGQAVLDATAAHPGIAGEDIRLIVTYTPSAPDSSFDLEVFRWEYDATGTKRAAQAERYTGLTMDPDSNLYAPAVLTQQSALIDVGDPNPGVVANGSSQAAAAIPWRAAAMTTLRDQWEALIGLTSPAPPIDQTLTVSVDGGDPVPVSFETVDVGNIAADAGFRGNLGTAIGNAITAAHDDVGRPGVAVDIAFPDGPAIATVDDALHGGANLDSTSYFRISSTTGGAIRIIDDGLLLARTLRMGTAFGGIETAPFAARRPAPNAAILDPAGLNVIGALTQGDLTNLTLDGEVIVIPVTDAARPIFVPAAGGWAAGGHGGLDGITERLRAIRDAVNGHASAVPSFGWVAELWGTRLALRRTNGGDNEMLPGDFATAGTDIAGNFVGNARFATVGVSGNNTGFQVSAAGVALDGNPPQSVDYDAAYAIAERELDIFNLLVLPEATGGADRKSLWPAASVACQKNRAFLVMDPPETWTDHTEPVDGTGANDSIANLKTGLVKDHAAMFYPKLLIDKGGRRVVTDPAGAIAGLMARIDERRGVWKAPAGTEADIRGITGVKTVFTDGENGNLNPRGINTIRRFPTGIVNWGARTMDGDDSSGSEYKYIPVRRLLLYLEESIYRGLQWTVFEPNGFDLWAAIRLNVGNFLNGLHRQGAFAGETASDSYYVACGPDTTTPTDQALGIVNVHVGVATLKPAEFVVLSFRQITLPEQ